MNYLKLYSLSVLFMSIAQCSCSNRHLDQRIPEKVNQALSKADTNIHELNKVISYYGRFSKDSLKLKAAFFLIENMPGKGFVEYQLQDADGRPVALDLFVQREKRILKKPKKNMNLLIIPLYNMYRLDSERTSVS